MGKGWNVENVTNGKTAFSCCKSLPNFDENNSGVDISFANQYVKDESEKPKTEQYKVTYSFTGDIIPEGVEAPVEATYDAGKTVTVAENPSADKYIFSGWTTEDATVENGEFVINNDVNFVGSWTKLYKVEYKYEAGYDVPEGALELPEAVYYKAGDEVDLLGIPYVDRHIFIGWYTDDADIFGTMFDMPANDVVIYGYYKIPVESIEILDTEDIVLNENDKTTISVYVKPEDATIKTVVYESSDESVVIIDKYNRIVAVGEGEATVTVKSADDPTKSDTIKVTVKKPVTEITVDPTDLTIREESSGKINVTVNEEATNKNIIYKSNDESIVTVDENGNITSYKKAGTTTITVTSEDNPDVKKEVTVTVKNPVTDITVEDPITLTVGDEKDIDAKTNDDASYKDLFYEVENSGVAKVDSEGTVIAVGEGTTTIKITSVDNPEITETVTITVKPKTYKVTYEFVGTVRPENEPAKPEDKFYKADIKVDVEPVAYAEGYIFSGWTTEDATVEGNKFTMPENEVHFIGSWTKINYYDVTYEYTGDIPEGYEAPDKATYEEGKTVIVATTPSADGYIFEGWKSEDIDASKDSFVIDKNVHIVGNWVKLYAVKYEYTGDVPENAPELPKVEDFKAGDNVTVKGVPSVEGYTFIGWTTEDATVSDNAFTMPSKDVVLKGRFKKNVSDIAINIEKTDLVIGETSEITVTVTPDDAEEKGVTYESSDHKVVKIDENGKIEAVGKGTATITVTSKDNSEIKEEITVTVEAKKYNVTYEYTGDVPVSAVVPGTKTYEEGTTVTVAAAPSKDGYIFSGWSSDDSDISSGSFVINKDTVIVGKWTKIPEYTVTYKYVGEVPPLAPECSVKTYRKGTVVAVEKDVSAEGYIFNGWTSEDINVADGKFVVDKNIVITGSWTKINYYSVIYKYVGDLVPEKAPTYETKIYKEGSNVTVYDAPYVDGYIFSGWSSSDADISKGNFNIQNNVIIVGSWTKAPGPVTEITVPKDFTLVLGEETTLNAYVNDNAINKNLVFESSNPEIATVDADGNVKSVSEGIVKIKISSAENPAIYGIVTITVAAEPVYSTKHYIVFGKTEKIGYYTVSLDGGETYLLVFGNSHLEVEHGSEIIVKAHDVFGDPFTFYINGKAVKPDENGFVRVKVDSYLLIGALGIPVEAPDAEESLNFFQRLIKSIKDFFAKIASWFKR